jgi:Histidine kinase-, DNA gyrase B-, and HSP90-like ATPase
MSREYKILTDVKGKILKTAAESIYVDTSLKIREAVTNSIDNDASTFIFTLKKKNESEPLKLSLFDNGSGITVKRFKKIFKNIGRGLHLDDREPKKKYSHYGLGLMSVFELGSKVSIITKAKESSNIIKLEVDAKKLFSEEMENLSVAAFGKCFRLFDSNNEERDELSPLSQNNIKELTGKFPNSFTEFIVEDIDSQDLELIRANDFFKNLSSQLPLRPDEESIFLNSLKKEHKDLILLLLKNKQYCPSIKFYFSQPMFDKFEELTKYFPTFKHLSRTNYKLFSHNHGVFSYYLIVGRNALGKPEENRDTGLWLRSKNVLVKGSDYLGYGSGGKSLCDKVVGTWIFGEIFHENMIEFLDASRNNFKVGVEAFRKFRKEIEDIVTPKCKDLRESYDKGHDIEDALQNTYDAFRDAERSPLKKLEEKLANAEGLGEKSGDHESDITKILNRLSFIHSPELEKCPDFYDTITEPIEFTPEGMKNYGVKIDPSVSESTISKHQVIIPADIFKSFEYTFLGRGFKVRFVKSEIKKAMSFNIESESRTITLNVAYPDLLKYNISYIDVIGVLEYASDKAFDYHECKFMCPDGKELDCKDCLDIMKRIVSETLAGKDQKDRSKIFRPLFGGQ